MKALRLLLIHFESGPTPIDDNPRTNCTVLSLEITVRNSYISVCRLSFTGVDPALKIEVDQQQTRSHEMGWAGGERGGEGEGEGKGEGGEGGEGEGLSLTFN